MSKNIDSRIPAVAYYRMSRNKQDASIPAQRKAVEKYATQHGYRIIRDYVDEGISGDDTKKRLQFRRLIADARDGEFKVVICWDQDRFGRFDPIEAGFWITPLREAGVRLETVAQGLIDWENFAGRVVWSVQQEAKHAYLRDLSRNVARGHIETALRGHWNGGVPPLGYSVKKLKDGKKQLVLDILHKVELVRRIFREYLNGESLRSLARKLTSEDIPPPSGRSNRAWNPNSVRAILGNPLYTGDYVWNRVSKARYTQILNGTPEKAGKSDNTNRNDEDQWIKVENNHPPIVDRHCFERVQQRLADRRSQTSPSRSAKFILTGLLTCGHCGSVMYGDASEGRYICNGYKTHGRTRCRWYSVRQDRIIEILVSEIQDRLLSPDNQERLVEAIKRRVRSRANPSERKGLRKQLEEIERKIECARCRLVEVDRDLLDEVQHALRRLKSQRDAVVARLRAVEQSQEEAQQEELKSVRRALNRVQRLTETVQRANSREAREALSTTISRATLYFRCESRGKRSRYHLARGTIQLSDKIVSDLSNPASPVSCRS